MKKVLIGVSCIFTLFMMIGYLLITPLDDLVTAGGSGELWTAIITAFKTETKDVSQEYGYYEWDNMEVLPGAMDVVYYSQKDSQWASKYYDTRLIKTQTIRSGGCGPTSLAIVYSSLMEEDLNPAEMADFAMEHGYCAAPQGSYRSLFTTGVELLELKNYYSGEDLETALEYLSQDCLIVALMGSGIFCDSGHFVVIRGVTDEGKILIADCWNADNNDLEWDINTIAQNLKADGGGCLWVIGLEEEEGATE